MADDDPTLPYTKQPVESEDRLSHVRSLHQVGRYQVLEEIAMGGQAVVLKGADPVGRLVALKMLRTSDAKTVKRFTREAKVLSRLRHENLPVVYELGKSGGVPYLAMQYVQGDDLGVRVKRYGVPDIPWTAAVLEPIARAVHYCHENGIVHRDLKPTNIMLEASSERPLLVDFGLLRRIKPSRPLLGMFDRETWSGSGEMVGTPPFMAPEQADERFGPFGVWTDVYALGATLYFLLTGTYPFRGGNPWEVCERVIQEPAPDPRTLNSLVPTSLAELCLQSLSKDPGDRPLSAAVFSEGLKGYLRVSTRLAQVRRRARPMSQRYRRPPSRAATVADRAIMGVLVVFAAVAVVGAAIAFTRLIQGPQVPLGGGPEVVVEQPKPPGLPR